MNEKIGNINEQKILLTQKETQIMQQIADLKYKESLLEIELEKINMALNLLESTETELFWDSLRRLGLQL